MEKGTLQDFDALYAIMEEAFPEVERRSYEGQKALLQLPHYHLYIQKKEGRIQAFVSIWEYADFIFIEHLAVASSYRNLGIGVKLLLEVIKRYCKDAVLEVELPHTSIAKRRISFYERLGFFANAAFRYKQPPLQPGFAPLPLCLMSYPRVLDIERFHIVQKLLYADVYGMTDVWKGDDHGIYFS